MRLQIESLPQGEYGIAAVSGEIDLATVDELRDALHRLIEAGTRHLVLDLAQVSFIDSTGLGVLVGARSKVESLNGSFSIAGATPRTFKLFRITGLTSVFTFFERRQDALPSSGPLTPA